ncbi:MAG: hypothetical protein ACOX41_06065 [Anaerovoracaceae bacterium]
MKIRKSAILLAAVLLAAAVLMTACVTNNKINEAMQDRDVKQVTAYVKEYSEKDKQEKFDPVVTAAAKKLLQKQKPDNFAFVESLIAKTRDYGVSSQLEKTLTAAADKLLQEKTLKNYEFVDSLITQTKDEKIAAALEKTLLSAAEDLAKEKDYDNFELLDSLIRSTKNKELKKDLTALEDKYAENKISGFLAGKWQRIRASEYANGMVIKVTWTNHKGTGRIVDVSKIGSDRFQWAVNDVKWKNVQAIDRKRFQFKEMWKYDDGYGTVTPEYVEGTTGEINYKKKIIKTHSPQSGSIDQTRDTYWEKIE